MSFQMVCVQGINKTTCVTNKKLRPSCQSIQCQLYDSRHDFKLGTEGVPMAITGLGPTPLVEGVSRHRSGGNSIHYYTRKGSKNPLTYSTSHRRTRDAPCIWTENVQQGEP
ncbi:hypothetical protein AVEN_231602-1 [Araneus ventricosus]|uniref:Uncharacterized protein n=1 Tax=Araneus ventricosus TaxID=182803 RepID=A0A4Y2FX72_ARAVE|nr:hypothetical protein AVEN_231602-1 [Araneus ventricosus]